MEYSLTEENYCHLNSPNNYFISPKMPIKDHLQGLKSTSSSFKPNSQINYKTKTLMGDSSLHLNNSHKNYIQSMNKMKLMDSKELMRVDHQAGKQNCCIGSHHTRQTNPGFSRNKDGGGFFTS